MKPEQAIQLLTNATHQLKLTYDEHVKIQIAIDTLNNLIKPVKPEKSVEEADKAIA